MTDTQNLQAQLDATNTLLDTLIVAAFSERPAAYRTAMFTRLRAALEAPWTADRETAVHTAARELLAERILKLEAKLRAPTAGADEHDD